MKVVQSTDTDKDEKEEMIYLRFWKIEEKWITAEQRRCSDSNRGELSCSALPVALPFYLTELRKVGA